MAFVCSWEIETLTPWLPIIQTARNQPQKAASFPAPLFSVFQHTTAALSTGGSYPSPSTTRQRIRKLEHLFVGSIGSGRWAPATSPQWTLRVYWFLRGSFMSRLWQLSFRGLFERSFEEAQRCSNTLQSHPFSNKCTIIHHKCTRTPFFQTCHTKAPTCHLYWSPPPLAWPPTCWARWPKGLRGQRPMLAA